MKVLLLYIWTGGISGEFTSTVDLFYNLQKYMEVEYFICVEKKELTSNCIKLLIQNNNRDLLDRITLNKVFESDLLICTSNALFKDVILKTENLFVVDSLSLKKHNYILPKLKHKNIKIFSNPANITNSIPFEQIEYYHKFSEKRMRDFPKYYKPYPYNSKVETFLVDSFNYNRTTKPHLEIEKGIFFENIGKRIFEHLFHEKIVNYSNEGISYLDGLCYYLNLFNINGLMNHKPLVISKQLIREKLFMNRTDKLLNLIEDLNVN